MPGSMHESRCRGEPRACPGGNACAATQAPTARPRARASGLAHGCRQYTCKAPQAVVENANARVLASPASPNPAVPLEVFVVQPLHVVDAVPTAVSDVAPVTTRSDGSPMRA